MTQGHLLAFWALLVVACQVQTAPSQPESAGDGAPGLSQALVPIEGIVGQTVGTRSAEPSKSMPEDFDRTAAAHAELKARLGPLLAREAARTRRYVDGQGRTHVDLVGGAGHAVVARRNPRGELELGCVDNLADAERFFLAAGKSEGAR